MKTKKTLMTILVVSFLTFLNYSCEDIDDNIKIPTAEEVIQKDSELFNLIDRVTTTEENPMKDIVCIDFIYPIKLQIYNTVLQPLYSVTIIGDNDFSAFLGMLPVDQSLSISYPITTTLNDGTEFTVNNNTELKIAIDSCSQEDILTYCSGLFCTSTTQNNTTICVWKVQYEALGDNKYLSGYFDTNSDGTIKFYYDDQIYNGSWTLLFIGNELHININLEGTSQIATDWNIDRKVIVNADEIIIKNTPKDIHLKKKCQEVMSYEIGNAGPAGGIVFYDKGSYSNGWRYMEAASTDLSSVEWGCFGSTINNTSSSNLGKGMINSATILNFHDSLNNFYSNPAVCNILSEGTVVAKEALAYTQNGFDDWFLPSHDELILMYQKLHLQALSNFSNEIYWSSTQFDENNVRTINFVSGISIVTLKNSTNKARAIRCF
ncbi:hypothetical protein [Flavobacterium sp.]